MKMIREIEESKNNKKITARVTMQQEIKDETDDKEFSTDNESMGSVTHIPKATGVNNSDTDTESMLIDRKEESESNGDENESMGSTDEEILKIEEKARESKEEDDEEEWKENNKDSEDESSDSECE